MCGRGGWRGVEVGGEMRWGEVSWMWGERGGGGRENPFIVHVDLTRNMK